MKHPNTVTKIPLAERGIEFFGAYNSSFLIQPANVAQAVLWDRESMLTKQTGWCYLMSSREHIECSTGLIYIGLALRQKWLFIKMTTTTLLGLVAGIARNTPHSSTSTLPKHTHRDIRIQNHNGLHYTNKHMSESKEERGAGVLSSAEMRRDVISYWAPCAPFSAGSRRTNTSKFPTWGKQTKTYEYFIFAPHTHKHKQNHDMAVIIPPYSIIIYAFLHLANALIISDLSSLTCSFRLHCVCVWLIQCNCIAATFSEKLPPCVEWALHIFFSTAPARKGVQSYFERASFTVPPAGKLIMREDHH